MHAGIWTEKLGFHNVWEFWAYNVVFGLFQAPYYAFSQTMMAELTPPGFDNMFFGLFGLSNRASSMIGPNVIQAIIDDTGDNWKGFPFLFALCAAASLVIWFGTCPVLYVAEEGTIADAKRLPQASMSPPGGATRSRGRRSTARMPTRASGGTSRRRGRCTLPPRRFRARSRLRRPV